MPAFSWTSRVLINKADRTAGKYLIKTLHGVDYLFVEWKTGDYVLRDEKPNYYVLVRGAGVPSRVRRDAEFPPIPSFMDCLFSPPLAGICKRPASSDSNPKPLDDLPTYSSSSPSQWQVDLRGRDISRLSLSGRRDDLLRATFDSATRFPQDLPGGFDPKRILELGKDPGLGLRTLHQEGIDGRGVGIAIIDQNLLVEHAEYAGQIRAYEELHWPGDWQAASMHAGAVASLAAGKNCGVSPRASIYYIADWFGERAGGTNYAFLARAIDRVLAFNKSASKGNRIRVAIIQRGFASREKGYSEVRAAIERAKLAGVFVITSSLDETHGFRFQGLGREPMSDPNDPQSYGPGSFWQRDFLSGHTPVETLLVPMDSRTTAGPDSVHAYAFYREGGWSWAIPYVAGLYALASQVRPDVGPDLFWKKALETGDVITIEAGRKKVHLERVVNPRRLIEALKGGTVLPSSDSRSPRR